MSVVTIPSFLAPALGATDRRPVLRFHDEGAWRSYSAKEWSQLLRELAAGLLAYGAGPGIPIAVVGSASVESVLSELAVQALGGIVVPIERDVGTGALRSILSRSESRIAIVRDVDRLQQVLEVRPELPALELVLLARPPAGEVVAPAVLLDAVRALGGDRLADAPQTVEEAGRALTAGHTACLLAGEAHGGVDDLAPSHENLVRASEALATALPVGPTDIVLASASLEEHVRRELLLLCLSRGAELVLGRTGRGLGGDLAEIAPSVVVAPHVEVEDLVRGAIAALRARRWLARLLAEWALRKGKERSRPATTGLRLADVMVLGRMRGRLTGTALRRLVALGPPLSDDARSHLAALGVPTAEGAPSLAACGILSLGVAEGSRAGTLGRPLPGIEARRSPEGDLRIRGPMIAMPWGSDRGGQAPGAWVPGGPGFDLDADGWVIPGS